MVSVIIPIDESNEVETGRMFLMTIVSRSKLGKVEYGVIYPLTLRSVVWLIQTKSGRGQLKFIQRLPESKRLYLIGLNKNWVWQNDLGTDQIKLE